MPDPTPTLMMETPLLGPLQGGAGQPTLLVLSGIEAGKVCRLHQGSVVVGRSGGAGLALDGDLVSRRHAELLIRPSGRVFVCDLGSTNGTLVNGTRLGDAPCALMDGDRVQVGDVLLKFTYQDALEGDIQEMLFSAAIRDALTGAYNRRYLMERLRQEYAFATRHGEPLSVALLDLDHFKSVNDAFGHVAGDEVLRATARFVAQRVRCEDVFARYGGEEFAVVMRRTDLAGALTMAERLRSGIAENVVELAGRLLSVTVSMGVAVTTCGPCETPLDLLVRADRLLYEAKAAGRNCLCHDVAPPAASGR